MIFEWILGYAAAKVLDSLWGSTSSRPLKSQLEAEMTNWMGTLPSGMKLSSSAALLANRLQGGTLDERVHLPKLQGALQRKKLPEPKVWKLALQEQWSFVRNSADEPEDIQEFFSSDEEVVFPYLADLAQRLHDICAQRQEFFGPAAIAETREMRAELSQISSKLGVYTQGKVDGEPGYLLINKLVDELRAAIKDDEKAKRTIDNLQIYKRDRKPRDGIIGLEGKLENAGRGYELEGALDQKQLFVELLEKWSYYASAQEIFAHLLARMRRCFDTKILPNIPHSAAAGIDALVDSEVVEPILNECSQIPQFTVNSDVALGMYYWLADQCYVRWHS